MTGPGTITIGEEFVVNRIGLGTNRIEDDDRSRAILEAAAELRVNFVDTADIYTGGVSERVVGQMLSGREGVLIATKGGYYGASPDDLSTSLDASLARLGLDTIDLYYLHRPDPAIPLEQSLATIVDARDAGKIRQIGLSNVTVDQIRSARLLTPVAAVQNEYNLEHVDDGGVIDYCTEHSIAFVPYFPLRGSKRAGKIAERVQASPHQVTLAAMLQRSPIIAPIPGTLSVQHLNANLAAAGIELTDAQLNELGINRNFS